MKAILALCALPALLLPPTPAPLAAAPFQSRPSLAAPIQNVAASQPAGVAKGGELAALERKLLGTWQGGPCAGDYTFNADGTFQLKHFTPGGNTLTGAWSLRWDALPPTLVLTFKTSDFKEKDPGRAEYRHLGKSLEVKVLELDDASLVYRLPSDKTEWRGSRAAK
jgi:hypothetical protein